VKFDGGEIDCQEGSSFEGLHPRTMKLRREGLFLFSSIECYTVFQYLFTYRYPLDSSSSCALGGSPVKPA